jgi:ADP-heptose:LPS heptosyltransferase
LRRRRYALSINVHPQGRREYRWIARLIGARMRLSHSYENESGLDRWLVTHSLPQDYSLHCIENNLKLLGSTGLTPRLDGHEYELYLSPQELSAASEFVQRRGLGLRQLLGVHVGSGGTKNLALRRWPIASYIQLFDALLARSPRLAILLFGGPDEAEAHERIQSAVRDPRVMAPGTGSIREAAALLGHCQSFLSVDTVFMHLAAAMKVPNQYVIETPTLNPPVFPRRERWVRVPNPAVGGRALDWYRYDGRPIAGGAEAIQRAMESVTVESVIEHMTPGLEE